jgi:hypothetical protein
MTSFDPNQPTINMEFHRCFCAVHGEPFREQWPKGYVSFVLPAMQAVLEQEGFRAYAGGDVEKINELLDQRPVCCRLSPDRLCQAYVESGVGVQGKCVCCGNRGPGTPYSMATFPGGPAERHKHVCFLCVVHRIREKKT